MQPNKQGIKVRGRKIPDRGSQVKTLCTYLENLA